MGWLVKLFLVIPFFVWIVIAGIIVYLIVKRVDQKNKETFEKRDN